MSLAARRTLLLAALLLALLAAPPVRAQPDDDVPPGQTWGQGTHAFRAILFKRGLKPVTDRTALLEEPKRTAVIVLGNAGVLRQLDGSGSEGIAWRRFVHAGGALLVATDQPTEPDSPLRGFQVAVNGNFIQTTNMPAAYQSLMDCPRLVPMGAPFSRYDNQVAANKPSFLVMLPGHSLPVLAQLPQRCYWMPRRGGTRIPFGDAAPLFAVGGPKGEGRIMVLADHSLFINDMMIPYDLRNFELAGDLIDWLTESGKRDQVMLYDNGVLRSTFEVSLKEPPLPSDADLLALANKFLRDLSKERFLDRLLPAWLLPVILTVVLLGYGFVRLTGSRHRIDTGAPLFAGALARLTPTETLAEQRQLALLGTDNFWEPARALAREVFESATGQADPETPPEVRAVGGWRERRQLRRLVRRLWELAYGDVPVPVSAEEFPQLLAQIDRVKRALATGRAALV
jgi:hypothetical protein